MLTVKDMPYQTLLYKPLLGQYAFLLESDRLATLANLQLGTAATVPAANNIDWSLGSTFTKTITGNTVLTFSNTSEKTITVVITASGAYTVTWPTIQWAGGTPPVQTSTATDIYEISKVGSVFYGRRIIAAAS